MSRFFSATGLLCVLLLSACGFNSGPPLSLDKVATLQPHRTTYDTVLRTLGTPSSQGENGDGSRTLTYYSSKFTMGAGTFIPMLNWATASSEMRTASLTLSFDSHGILTDKRYSSSDMCQRGLGPFGGSQPGTC